MKAFAELSEIDEANVVRCARVLLRRPLLSSSGPDGDLLPMIYRHRAVLQELFSTLLGYRLVVERRFARLYKTGPGDDATRGEPSLSPRGYTYLALALAALTGIGRQVLLSRLADEVRAAAEEAGVAVHDDPADRRALAAALRHLVSLGVITETEGAVDTNAEALITIDTDVLGHLLAGRLGEASTAEELIATSVGAGWRGTEHAVRRRLVEDPVVLFDDLPPDQAAWLRQNHARESALLERYFGLVTETRQEGIVASDPEDYLTDVVFPGQGTVARVALLALPRLLDVSHPVERTGRHPVSREDLAGVCQELVVSHPAAWSKVATEDPDYLVDAVATLLRRLGLLRQEGSEWLLSPAAHRWSPQADAAPLPGREPEPAPEPPVWSLFDDEDEVGTR